MQTESLQTDDEKFTLYSKVISNKSIPNTSSGSNVTVLFARDEYELTGYTFLLVSEYYITGNFGFICIFSDTPGIQFSLFNITSRTASGTINAKFLYYKK